MSARIHQFTNEVFTFPVTDEGPIDGDVVVLLHGFPQTSKSWDAVCARLNESGCRTIRFDQRGYAPTARPRGRRAYRLSALTGDVAALVDAVGSPVHLVGHDWGSAVAWATAASRPALLKSLTAVSVGHPAAFQRSMLSSTQALRSYYMLLFQIPWLPEAIARRYPRVFHRVLAGSGMSASAIEDVQHDVIDCGALTGGLAWYRALAFQDKASSAPVAVPTTYLWSTDDIALGRRAADLTERYVSGPYRFEVATGSHWLPEDQPELVANLIVDRMNGR